MSPFCALFSAPNDSTVNTFMKLVSESVGELEATAAGPAANVES